MTKIFRTYERSFVLDEAKLRRIVTLTDEAFTSYGITLRHKFNVNTKGSRHYTFSNVEEVLALDNSRKERIQELLIRFTDANGSEDDKVDQVEVHFHGYLNTRLCLDVRNSDTRLANELHSILDEQMERAIKNDLMHLISHQKWSVAIIVTLAVVLIWFLLSLAGRQSANFTLGTLAIEELESILDNPFYSDEERAQKIIILFAERTINVEKLRERGFWERVISNWISLFLIIPPVIVIVAFVYIAYVCYPNAVYLWGDGREWYSTLESRRKAIWSLIIASIVIGTLTNLFVLSLDRFLP